MTFKQILKYCLGCIKRSLILIIPILCVTMLLIDIITAGNDYYSNNSALVWLKTTGTLFYIICLWYILRPFNKWNNLALIVSIILVVGLIYFNPDLKKMYQHSKCIEDLTYPCPSGVILKGG